MTHYNSVSHLHRLNQAKKEMNSSNSQLIGSQSSNNDLLNDSIDELFKCNICKVSFNNGQSLDNHIQSAHHQNRVSKLAQLAISGQIDLNKPLVERPTNNSNKMNDESNGNNMNILNEQLQLLQQLQTQQSNNSNGENSSQLNCSQCSMVFNNQDSLNQHQQVCLFLSSLNKASTNQPNNNINLDLIQSQLSNSNNKFFTLPACKNKPPVYKHLLETWGYEIVQQFNEHHQRRKKQNDNEDEKMDTLNNEENDDDDNEMNAEDEEEKIHYIIRLKEPESKEEDMEEIKIKTEVDETDNNEEPKASNSDNQEEDDIDKEKIKLILDQEDDQEDKKENDPNTTNNQDQNKFKCETCLKEFSSIWVLKAHKEEVHNDIVKMEKVQDFAEIYRKEFLERKNNIVVKSVVLDNENSNHVQRTQSSTPITSTVTTQSSNVNNNLSSTAVDQQSNKTSNNNSDNNDSLNDSKANASQSTNELNNSTNSINANNSNSNNNSNNDLANSLLSGNPLNNPLLAANPLLANNPLLSQAVAGMMQQNSNNSTNNSNNASDVANQMAQLQVNQLLMSLSLAGAMNSNANNNSSNQQQAAMMALLQQGIPPQMLPILMANAQANPTPDPMMSLFASNPMLAAAANAVNPLASFLGGMTPEAMVAAGLLPGMINNLQQQNSQNTSKSPSLNTASTSNPLTASPSTSLLNSTVGSCQAAQNAQSGKRARTRISDDQLKILRQYFDINNSPTEEALQGKFFIIILLRLFSLNYYLTNLLILI